MNGLDPVTPDLDPKPIEINGNVEPTTENSDPDPSTEASTEASTEDGEQVSE